MLSIAVVDCGSRKVPDIVTLLEQAGAVATRLDLAAANTAPFSGHHAMVLSGGPRLFTDEPALVDAFAFLDELAIPALGICLGHQAIALRAAAAIHLGPPRCGPEPLQLTPEGRDHPLLSGLPSLPTMQADHREGVSLPAGFTLLASSECYGVEAMAAPAPLRLGVQFHPEISGDPGRRLLHNFVRMVAGAAQGTSTLVGARIEQ